MYVTVHKISHALGLDHSDVWGSVMWPAARTGTPALHQSDINGIGSIMVSMGSNINPYSLTKV